MYTFLQISCKLKKNFSKKIMKKTLPVIIFLLLCGYSSFAQSGSSQCPLVTLIEPSSVAQPGETLTFSALIQGERKNNLKYKWKVNAGTILEGEKETTVHISTEGLDSIRITAVFEIEGLPIGCQNKFEEVGIVAPGIICGLQETYGAISFNEEMARLDAFFVDLQQDSEYQGYILIKSDENESATDIKKRIQKIVKHIKYRKAPINNFIFAIEKSDSHLTTLIPVSKLRELPECENCEIIKGADLK